VKGGGDFVFCLEKDRKKTQRIIIKIRYEGEKGEKKRLTSKCQRKWEIKRGKKRKKKKTRDHTRYVPERKKAFGFTTLR